jgi:MSHA type pilus biogenesis protein MshL
LPEPSALNKKVNLVCAGSPLGVVLSELASEAGFKVMFDSGVNRQAPVIERLEFIPIIEAIQAVLRPFGYDWRYSDKTINIISIETRAYRVELPVIKSAFDNSITNMPSSGDETIASRAGAKVSLKTVNPEISIWKDIEKNVKNMVSKEGSYTINEATGVITVKDTPKNLDTIGEYLAILNKECRKQVEIECKIVEVTLNKKFEYGIDWSVLTDLGDIQKLKVASDIASTEMTGAMFKITAEGDKWEGSGTTVRGVKALIHALETQGDVNVLSQPKQILINNQPAVIQVGDIKTYVSEVQKETTQIGDTYSVETSDIQSGVIMYLLARITDDNTIFTHISPVVTTINEIRQITYGDTVVEAPDTTSKSINTVVRMNSGDTIVIGGLITARNEQTRKGLPVLSWIPLVGELFKYNLSEDKKTEIVIFLTPRIVEI